MSPSELKVRIRLLKEAIEFYRACQYAAPFVRGTPEYGVTYYRYAKKMLDLKTKELKELAQGTHPAL